MPQCHTDSWKSGVYLLLHRSSILRIENKFLDISVCYVIWSFFLCCFTRQDVAGSIPDSVIAIHHWHNGPEVYSASNRNECQEYFLENSCAGSLEISESQPTGTFTVCSSLHRDCSTFYFIMNNVLDTMCKDRSCYDLPSWRIFTNILSHFSVPVETRIGHFAGTIRVTAWVFGFADRVY